MIVRIFLSLFISGFIFLSDARASVSSEEGIDFPWKKTEMPIGFKSQIVPSCNARVDVIEGFSGDGRPSKEYPIIICDAPVGDAKRFEWGVKIESQKLAHGSLWVKLIKKNGWNAIYYHMPENDKDFELLDTQGADAFRLDMEEIEYKNVPLFIRMLPTDVREQHMLGFIAYYNGAFEILLLESDKDIAKAIAKAVNDTLRNSQSKK